MNDIKKQLQQVTDLLDKVQKRIDHPDKWSMLWDAIDEDGIRCILYEEYKTASRWNILGAFIVESEGVDEEVVNIAKNYLATAMLSIDIYEDLTHKDSDESVLFHWNFQPGRTHAEVMKAFSIARDVINQDMARYCS